ncbi:MAG: uncharacterized protein KVP18_003239 [Porospora cf. gigantea A]|nr:MAG: hypothetical protein KVP18_003239 [Porospora cf. gigantea A]
MDDDVDDVLVDTWVYTVEEVSELATRYLGDWGVVRLGYSFRLNKRMNLHFQFPFLWADEPLPLFGSFANLYSREFAEAALQIYGFENGKITKFPDTRKPYQVDVGLITGTLMSAGLQQAIVFPQMFTVDVLEWLTQTNLRSPLGLAADDAMAFGNVDGLKVLSRLATVYNGMSHLRATSVAILASRIFGDVYRSFREMRPDLPRHELLVLTFRYIGRWRRDVASRLFNIHSGYYNLELEVPEMLGLVVD